MGIGVSLAFRLFTYGILTAILYGSSWWQMRGLPPLINHTLTVVYWLVALASPLWTPFAAGFVSAYFWRHLEVKDYIQAIWIVVFAFWGVAILASSLLMFPAGCFGLIFFCLDAGMCGSGVEQGSKFWNGHLGRQFLGDFSTRDAENE